MLSRPGLGLQGMSWSLALAGAGPEGMSCVIGLCSASRACQGFNIWHVSTRADYSRTATVGLPL